MTTPEIIETLKAQGSPAYAALFVKHGAKGTLYGVSVAALKEIKKKLKKNHEIALELFDTRISDAMYLAGLISEPEKMSREQLQHWAETATWHLISEYAVAWSAAESRFGPELALKWIDSKEEAVATAGWATLGHLCMLQSATAPDPVLFARLLRRVEETIQQSANRVRYTMNGFVIAAGGGIPELTDTAIATGRNIGTVAVYMGQTACKVPDAVAAIQKMQAKGVIGKKKKTVRC